MAFPQSWGLEVGLGRHRKNEKQNSTLAKGALQTTGALEVGSHCAELVRVFIEAAGLKPPHKI